MNSPRKRRARLSLGLLRLTSLSGSRRHLPVCKKGLESRDEPRSPPVGQIGPKPLSSHKHPRPDANQKIDVGDTPEPPRQAACQLGSCRNPRWRRCGRWWQDCRGGGSGTAAAFCFPSRQRESRLRHSGRPAWLPARCLAPSGHRAMARMPRLRSQKYSVAGAETGQVRDQDRPVRSVSAGSQSFRCGTATPAAQIMVALGISISPMNAPSIPRTSTRRSSRTSTPSSSSRRFA